jgi:NADH-quinone oxidoreductase subunit A
VTLAANKNPAGSLPIQGHRLKRAVATREVTLVEPFGFIGLFIVVSFLLAAVPLILNALLAPNKPNPIKSETYECGIETVGETWIQFKAQYYIYALIFVVFDVEAVFLLPWAVAFKQLEIFGIVAMIVFILLLVDGLVYAWRKGDLEWA